MKKVDILCGLQYGSEGKGLIAGHVALWDGYDTCISVNMPNAGHTYKNEFNTWIFKVLPNGAVHPNIKTVMIGPDAVFSKEQLLTECSQVPNIMDKLVIHENAVPLGNYHVADEQGMMERIGSTAQGSSAAMIDKIKRYPKITIGANPGPFKNQIVDNGTWMEIMAGAENILLEGCQGYSLGLNAGFYPYCTSRDCTPGRLAAGAGIPHTWIRKVIGAARIYPIRVGGNSGGVYSDQEEMKWEDEGLTPELTTVTQRERRLFSFSRLQMIDAVIACQPDRVFLNFCNYNPTRANIIKDAINGILGSYGPPNAKVFYTGWGPADSDVKYEE